MARIKTLGMGWSGHPGRPAWDALRICAALWLVGYIVYTPIHLYLEPHCEDSHRNSGEAQRGDGVVIIGETHDGDDHSDRHPASQHKFKITHQARAIPAELMPVEAMTWVKPYADCPQTQVVGFSGLSPPEFSCSWQFLFRAALPVRAPSLLS